MNATLRGKTPELLAKESPLIKLAASACNRLRPFVGTVYRGVLLTKQQLDCYVAGEVITEKSFLSTTRNGQSWHLAPEHCNTLFVIQATKNGHDISTLSGFLDEQEVLFVPGIRFKVLSRETELSGKTVIYLSECSCS